MSQDNGMDCEPSWQELKDERDDLEERYHLLASEMVYEGNSVQHWQHKARAYKECAGAVYDLKQIMGAETPAEVVKAAQALAAHVEFCHKVLSMVENGPSYLVARQYRALKMARERKPTTSLARLKAEGALAVRHLTQGEDWEDQELREVIDDYVAELRRQAEEVSHE